MEEWKLNATLPASTAATYEKVRSAQAADHSLREGGGGGGGGGGGEMH